MQLIISTGQHHLLFTYRALDKLFIARHPADSNAARIQIDVDKAVPFAGQWLQDDCPSECKTHICRVLQSCKNYGIRLDTTL